MSAGDGGPVAVCLKCGHKLTAYEAYMHCPVEDDLRAQHTAGPLGQAVRLRRLNADEQQPGKPTDAIRGIAQANFWRIAVMPDGTEVPIWRDYKKRGYGFALPSGEQCLVRGGTVKLGRVLLGRADPAYSSIRGNLELQFDPSDVVRAVVAYSPRKDTDNG
jgi:hypothetical protein